jgi:hypothetical protein
MILPCILVMKHEYMCIFSFICVYYYTTYILVLDIASPFFFIIFMIFLAFWWQDMNTYLG